MVILQDELTKKKDKGSISLEGTTDILTAALGTQEHPGRVRAQGHFVTPSMYFHTAKCGWEEKEKMMELRIQSLEAELRAVKEQGSNAGTPVSERVSSNRPTCDVHIRYCLPYIYIIDLNI